MLKVEQTNEGDWTAFNDDPNRDHRFYYPTRKQAEACAKRWNAITFPTYQQRAREACPDHADEAVALTEAFLNAHPDCAY